MKNKTIGYAGLYDFPSLKEMLQKDFNLSISQIKKSHLSVKELKNPVKKRESCQLLLNHVNHLEINPKYVGPTVEVLFEDENFLAINKPPHIHTHPLSYCESDNCLSFLRENGFYSVLKINHNNYDRGLLYRLDYGTSGVLVLTKKSTIYSIIRNEFLKSTKSKTYLAVVSGKWSQPDKEYFHYIRPSLKKGHKMVAYNEDEISKSEQECCQKGSLTVSYLDYDSKQNLSLLKVELTTGIRHQIRVQLAKLGYPILGDSLYHGLKEKRLFLHAYKYSFIFKNNQHNFIAKNALLFDKFFDFNCCF